MKKKKKRVFAVKQFKGMLQPIFCTDINSHSDRK